MPDGDVIRRGVRHAWRPAFEGLCGGHEGPEARRAILRSLTQALRTRGLPSLGEPIRLLGEHWSGQVSQAEALGRAASASRSVGGNRESSLLETAISRVIATGPMGSRPAQALIEAYCHTLVAAELMAKVRPALLEDATRRPSEVEARISAWTQSVEGPIRQLAQQLEADPTGSQLRAPPTPRRRRRATADLLDETV